MPTRDAPDEIPHVQPGSSKDTKGKPLYRRPGTKSAVLLVALGAVCAFAWLVTGALLFAFAKYDIDGGAGGASIAVSALLTLLLILLGMEYRRANREADNLETWYAYRLDDAKQNQADILDQLLDAHTDTRAELFAVINKVKLDLGEDIVRIRKALENLDTTVETIAERDRGVVSQMAVQQRETRDGLAQRLSTVEAQLAELTKTLAAVRQYQVQQHAERIDEGPKVNGSSHYLRSVRSES